MKWVRIGVTLLSFFLDAVKRGWNEGKADVQLENQRRKFERANSGEAAAERERSENEKRQ